MTVSVAVGSEDYRDHPRVLVIEDEESYREALLAGLRREGFVVDVAEDGPSGIRTFRERRPDIVLLDVLLPGMHGTEVCRRLRQIAPVPVVMVSAVDSELDVVLGLELGAAGYVTKPYRLRELIARMNAILRRVVPAAATGGPLPSIATLPAPSDVSGLTGLMGLMGLEGIAETAAEEHEAEHDEPVAAFGTVRVDFVRREVSVDGKPTHLSRREFDLLAVLLAPPGRVRSRDELIDLLWPDTVLSDSRTLDTHVHRLRAKLEPDPARPRYLVTVRGVGFRIEPDQPSA